MRANLWFATVREMQIEPEYLGDSVYVAIEDDMIKLTTNNGHPDDPRNVIFMEPEVVRAFEKWLARVREQRLIEPN